MEIEEAYPVTSLLATDSGTQSGGAELKHPLTSIGSDVVRLKVTASDCLRSPVSPVPFSGIVMAPLDAGDMGNVSRDHGSAVETLLVRLFTHRFC